MSFLDQLKELINFKPHLRHDCFKPPEDEKGVEDSLKNAIEGQKDATDRMSLQSSAIERSSRVASVVTKTLIRRRLDKPDILHSADEAMQIIEGAHNASSSK